MRKIIDHVFFFDGRLELPVTHAASLGQAPSQVVLDFTLVTQKRYNHTVGVGLLQITLSPGQIPHQQQEQIQTRMLMVDMFNRRSR